MYPNEHVQSIAERNAVLKSRMIVTKYKILIVDNTANNAAGNRAVTDTNASCLLIVRSPSETKATKMAIIIQKQLKKIILETISYVLLFNKIETVKTAAKQYSIPIVEINLFCLVGSHR